MTTRRAFLLRAGAATATAASGFGALAETARRPWDAGVVAHLLPTLSHERLLLKASFVAPLAAAPTLRVGNESARGERTDLAGAFWQFDVAGLAPDRMHTLALVGGDGRALCEPWPIRTFPAPDARPERLRVLIYTCAGGHEDIVDPRGRIGFIKTALRRRLIERGLDFEPDALIANGDHVYWDLLAPRGAPLLGESAIARRIAGQFDRAAPVLGGDNERKLLLATRPQIVPVYGAACRSTPVFFIKDDHDYFDNDEADDNIVTFPPDHFMIAMARGTQRLFYPEFLPDMGRPLGLPGSSLADRPPGVAESFGTLRYGTLAEILMYDIRRSQTLAGPSAVYLDRTVEAWLMARMAAPGVTHVVNVPSNPPGWSAGKWGEWYPDVLGADGKLTVAQPKPYWQSGWLKQHDRLMAAMSGMKQRVPLVVSGDLHAVGEGYIKRSGTLDLSHNPVVAVLAGPIGTGDLGWPSGFRGTGPKPPQHIDMDETLPPIEEHGFTLMDFMPDKIVLRFFRWNYRKEPPEAIDTLQPFRVTELKRPG